jgi:hypothetical protein
MLTYDPTPHSHLSENTPNPWTNQTHSGSLLTFTNNQSQKGSISPERLTLLTMSNHQGQRIRLFVKIGEKALL